MHRHPELQAQLEDSLYTQIVEFAMAGADHFEAGAYDQAIAQYQQAFNLIPKPFQGYAASTWLLTALGDAYFLALNYPEALKVLEDAMQCPEAIGNSFIHLRLGQVQFELGNISRARDELARAYMGGGKDIFASENPKYYQDLKTNMRDLEPS